MKITIRIMLVALLLTTFAGSALADGGGHMPPLPGGGGHLTVVSHLN